MGDVPTNAVLGDKPCIEPEVIKSLSYQFRVADLHDLVSVEQNRKNLLPVLDYFIRSQAALHHAEYIGTPDSLEDNILKKGNTFRGVVVYSQTSLPVAYAVYYPMVNDKGERGNYIEDAYVTESFRGHSVMPYVYHVLARRCSEEGAQFLQWSTDKRNFPFQGFSRKIGATRPATKTLIANDFLAEDYVPQQPSLRQAWDNTNFVTLPIEGKHVNMTKQFVTPDIIRRTGDLDFRGFITFRADDLRHPVALTPGWPHMSTFKLKHGLVLENPSFSEDSGLTDQDKVAIILSCAKAAKTYAAANEYSYLKWHVKDDGEAPSRVLQGEISLPIDTMVGTVESEMEIYNLRNGKLRELAKNKKNGVEIPVTTAIGARPPERRP